MSGGPIHSPVGDAHVAAFLQRLADGYAAGGYITLALAFAGAAHRLNADTLPTAAAVPAPPPEDNVVPFPLPRRSGPAPWALRPCDGGLAVLRNGQWVLQGGWLRAGQRWIPGNGEPARTVLRDEPPRPGAWPVQYRDGQDTRECSAAAFREWVVAAQASLDPASPPLSTTNDTRESVR